MELSEKFQIFFERCGENTRNEECGRKEEEGYLRVGVDPEEGNLQMRIIEGRFLYCW